MSEIINEILTKPYPVSNDQKEAVLSDSKYTRVIAGAGAGMRAQTMPKIDTYYSNIRTK